MKMIPFCHKCANAITECDLEFNQARVLVGCKACPSIEGYEDAKVHCPVIKEIANEERRK